MENTRYFISKLSSVILSVSLVILMVAMTCTGIAFAKVMANPDKVSYYLRGDVDGNGKVTAADARLALRAAVALEHYAPGSGEFVRADYDGDGNISASDARMILRTAVELEPIKYLNAGEDTSDPANPEDPTKPTEPDEPSSEPEETSTFHTPGDDLPPLPTSKYTEENDPYYYPGSRFVCDPERAGMYYYELRACEYVHFDYEDIPEGGRYKRYTDDGWLLDPEIKPYSSGNEPTTAEPVDDTHCRFCGKTVVTPSGFYGGDVDHNVCWYGGCSRWIADIECPDCGVFVPANTCHTCVH